MNDKKQPINNLVTKQKHLLKSLQTIQSSFLRKGISYGWCDSILEDLLILSESEFGFICELKETEDGTPFIRSHGISNIAWDDDTRRFHDENYKRGLDYFNFNSLWGQVFTSGEAVISNDPESDSRRGGYPKEKGHPPLKSFLGLPIKDTLDNIVGIMGVANRKDGYNEELIDFLVPFTSTYGFFIEKTRIDEQRLNTEEALKTTLKENKALLRELQHRAKNSFQLITSMISLSANDAQSEEVKSELNNINLRISAVSKMFALLYQSESITHIMLDKYLQEIIAAIPRNSINVRAQFDAIKMTAKPATLVGIITNELITNAVKYAFSGRDKGTISAILKETASGAVLEIADDGAGLPDDFDTTKITSLGLKMVEMLAEQINGTFTIENDQGTICTLEFPINQD